MVEKRADIRPVQQPLDQKTRDAVLALWSAADAVIENPEDRLAQITFLAFAGDEVVGSTSAQLVREHYTRQPLYSLRALVRKDWQQNLLAYDMLAHSVEAKEDAFIAGSNLDAVGVVVEIEAAFAINRTTFPGSRTFQFPINKTPKTFHFIGFDPRGIREYVHYFPSAKIIGTPTRPPSIRSKAISTPPDLRLELVNDGLGADQQEELIALWLGAGVIPNREACIARIPQVAALAYKADKLAGVSTVFPVLVPHLRVELLGYRSFISEGARGGQTATEMLNLVYADRNRRFVSAGHAPGLGGMVYSLQNAQLNASVVDTVSPRTGFVLAGFDQEGRQIRVRYFDDAELTLKQ